jgi:hypothetical protein
VLGDIWSKNWLMLANLSLAIVVKELCAIVGIVGAVAVFFLLAQTARTPTDSIRFSQSQ